MSYKWQFLTSLINSPFSNHSGKTRKFSYLCMNTYCYKKRHTFTKRKQVTLVSPWKNQGVFLWIILISILRKVP